MPDYTESVPKSKTPPEDPRAVLLAERLATMANHPNRSKKKKHVSANPTAQEIILARTARGLTQTEAAALIHSTLRTWQDWEAGIARMHPGLWELFQKKARPRRKRAPS